LWRSNGTALGTTSVQRFSFAPGANGRISALTSVAGKLYFVAGDNRFGYDVWLSEGGEDDDTEQLRHFATAPTELTAVGAVLYLVADDGGPGSELWRMDGTDDGSHLVADIWPGGNGSSPHALVAINNQLFFAANDGTHGTELWAVNGTTGSTKL